MTKRLIAFDGSVMSIAILQWALQNGSPSKSADTVLVLYNYGQPNFKGQLGVAKHFAMKYQIPMDSLKIFRHADATNLGFLKNLVLFGDLASLVAMLKFDEALVGFRRKPHWQDSVWKSALDTRPEFAHSLNDAIGDSGGQPIRFPFLKWDIDEVLDSKYGQKTEPEIYSRSFECGTSYTLHECGTCLRCKGKETIFSRYFQRQRTLNPTT